MTTEQLIKKYQNYVDNIQYHIDVSKPTGLELDSLEAQLHTNKSFVEDLEMLLASARVNSNGAYMILAERHEQIDKHRRKTSDDIRLNSEGQLKVAAINLISNAIQRENGCPKGWDQDLYNKMANKSMIDRLVISGALIAAEIDRLKNKR